MHVNIVTIWLCTWKQWVRDEFQQKSCRIKPSNMCVWKDQFMAPYGNMIHSCHRDYIAMNAYNAFSHRLPNSGYNQT